jgi:signal transduction histidine kinase
VNGKSTIEIASIRDFVFKLINRNGLLLAIVVALIGTLVVDTMINNVVDFISPQIVSNLGILLFIVIAIVSAVGQYIILRFVRQKSKEIRAKSLYIVMMHRSVIIIQSFLTAIIVFVILEMIFTARYFGITLTIATVTAYLLNVVLLALLTRQFFLWFRSNKNSIVVLFYGLSSAALAITAAIVVFYDSYDLLGKQGGITPYSKVEYPSFEPGTITTLFHNIYNYSDLVSFILVWISTALLLRHYSQKVGRAKYWLIIIAPLIYYLSSFVQFFNIYNPSSDTEQFYYYLYTSVNSTAGGFLFGIAFRSVAKAVWYNKVIKNYMVISAYGFIFLFISNQVSLTAASYPPFGIATISFMGLSSYLIFVGIYSSAISVAQDVKLRESIKKSALEESKLLVSIGSAQMEQKIQSKVVGIAKEQAHKMTKSTGIDISLTEDDIRDYLSVVIKEIKVLQNVNEIINKEKEILNNSIEFISCMRFGVLRLVYNNYFQLYDEIMTRSRNGEHKGIRLVTSILDNDDAELAKEFLDIGVQIRHVKNMPPIDFSVSDKEIIATLQNTVSGNNEGVVKNLLVSNDLLYIKHFTSIFEELWKGGVDASQRINDIEEGIGTEGIEIIQNALEIRKLAFDLIKNARQEIMIIFASANVFRNEEDSGTLQLLKESAKRGVKIRILAPIDPLVEETIEKDSRRTPELLQKQHPKQQQHGQQQQRLDHDEQLLQPTELRYIDPEIQTKVTILVVDKKFSLTIEFKEDTDRPLYEIMRLATYSNSRYTVLSYASIFDSLWKQSELYDKLKIQAKIQKDFIDIAAHELRTPITPILVMISAIKADLEEKEKKTEQEEEKDSIIIKQKEFDVIYRNAKKLKQLAEDILDVARIESDTLKIVREQFNLKDEIIKIVQEYSVNINDNDYGSKRNVKILYQQLGNNNDILVHADKGRIIQVVSNLLNNAIKFTTEGSITITTEQKDGYIIVGVKDTGTGIDPEILPRLFTKFATKSGKGTGLGLFISKSIVEAHDGNIWVDDIYTCGAAIKFSLPC